MHDSEAAQASSVRERFAGFIRGRLRGGWRQIAILPWWAYLALSLPALIPISAACIVPIMAGEVPTGFVQLDMPYYMANAREHFDQGFQLTYGNPYASYVTPAIYSQPQTLLLALMERTGLGPGLTFNIFGLAALLFATFVGVRFYNAYVGLETPAKKLGLVCFFWGGGLLIAAGVAKCVLTGQFHFGTLMRFDRDNGWWMLNFGRNLVYPTEAYYHGIMLLSLLLLIRRRFVGSLAMAALLSWSHPFTGLSLALTLVCYSALELALRSRAVKPSMLAGSSLIVLCHVAYYLVFLNRFADHRALQNQWTLDWLYRPATFLPALALVGLFAALRMWRRAGLKQVMGNPQTRLVLVWFIVVFGLSQHNLIMKPMQPIHFTHGNDWIALFILGAPALIALFERLLSIPAPRLRTFALALVLAVSMLDNSVWLIGNAFPSPIRNWIALTQDQKSVLDWLSKNSAPPVMVVCPDPILSYLVSTYTSVRSWYGHPYNTPWYEQRRSEVNQAFEQERFLPEWSRMHVLYISDRRADWRPPGHEVGLFQNDTFTVWGQRSDIAGGWPHP
jgi:hypothetical protein